MTTSSNVALALEWIDLLSGFLLFLFFVYQKKMKGRCKFEVLYVTGVGTFTDWVKIYMVDYSPATFTIKETGVIVNWSRWVGWLITCPVILIHLSNLAGREVFDIQRLMNMFIAFQIMCISGATASMIHTDIKYLFAFFSWMSLCVIFKHSQDIFKEAILTMPDKAKPYILRLAFIFVSTWSLFGVFFCMSSELSNIIDMSVARSAYAILDIFSKSGYAYTGWYIRWNILRKIEKPDEFIDEIKDKDSENKYKILLIEDDDIFAYFFHNILSQQKCQVDIVKSIKTATQKISNEFLYNQQYDMIITSYELVKYNNYENMKELRKSAYMLPIIAYGRTISTEDVNNRSLTGIDDFIVAPFPEKDINNKLLKWSRRMSVAFTKNCNLQVNNNIPTIPSLPPPNYITREDFTKIIKSIEEIKINTRNTLNEFLYSLNNYHLLNINNSLYK